MSEFSEQAQNAPKITPPVFIQEFLSAFFARVPGAYASDRTVSKYRKLAGCPGVSKTDRDHAELLLTALLYRPKSQTELQVLRRKYEREIAKMFSQVEADCEITIGHSVMGKHLRSAIFQVTGISLKCDRTLENYAVILAEQFNGLYFDKDADYPAVIATAFARLAVQRKFAQSHGGRHGAQIRWQQVA